MAKLDKLITYAYMKEENDIPQNIEDIQLEKKIYDAQETLRMIMGDEFYQDFLTSYNNNQLSIEYTRLYSYIKQYVARQAYEFYVVTANFNTTRSGFRVHTEENSIVATDLQMSTIIKDAKQKAQYYKKLLIDFLNGHNSDYSLYKLFCGNNISGNTFHVSAVGNIHRHRGVNRHHKNCGCMSCR